jgi:hypothetical protein
MPLPAFPLESIHPLATARSFIQNAWGQWGWSATPVPGVGINDAVPTFQPGSAIVTRIAGDVVSLVPQQPSSPPLSLPLPPTLGPIIANVQGWQDGFNNAVNVVQGIVGDLQGHNRELMLVNTVLTIIIALLLLYYCCRRRPKTRARPIDGGSDESNDEIKNSRDS